MANAKPSFIIAATQASGYTDFISVSYRPNTKKNLTTKKMVEQKNLIRSFILN